VTSTDEASLVLTGVFGLVTTVGVAYQIVDIRRRHGEADPVAPPLTNGLFAVFISPQAPFVAPGAPFFLGCVLCLAALALALRRAPSVAFAA